MDRTLDPLRVVTVSGRLIFPPGGEFCGAPILSVQSDPDPALALLSGSADLALFPALELPVDLPPGLALVAVVRESVCSLEPGEHPLSAMTAVVARRERADLKARLAPHDIRQSYGKVYLCGAGAGGRDYLTLRADALLRHAGVIFYDDLIDTSLLDGYDAEKVYVGKRKGHHHREQEEINRELYLAAQKKQIVVRLKGGDPLIFGRGGEELLCLRERHIDVEIVPGVSALQSAAAAAGIPLTMRGVSGGVTLQSAHNVLAGGKERTLVFFMCASRLQELQKILIEEEHVAPETPLALAYKAGFPDERVTLTSVSSMHLEEQASPLLAIVGRTASFSRKRERVLYLGRDPHSCLLPGKIVPRSHGRPLCEEGFEGFDAVALETEADTEVFLESVKAIPPHLLLYVYHNESASRLSAAGFGPSVVEFDSLP
ncbi:MAG: uroporphyrinogen-III C-methyltransferase [Chlorobiaceae bacterium]